MAEPQPTAVTPPTPIGQGQRPAIPVVLLVLVAAGAVVAGGVAAGRLFSPGSPAAAPAPRFVEEAVAAGIEHRYDGEFTYFVGGGVAAFDCDDDGREDLYFAGGAEPAELYRNASPVGGALRFEPIADAATDLDAVTGAYPLDIDGDGTTDLAVLRVGEDVLLRGLGDCRFERANEAWRFDGGEAWTAAFSATWEQDATLPTLAFGNYLVLDDAGEPQPDYACGDNDLFRPDAGGDAYGEPIALTHGWSALSVLFSDWDRSGRRDLRISNDRHYYRDGEEQLWRMEQGAPPRLWTQQEGWQTLRVFGMGIASTDLTGDGYPEVYLTSQADNKLQTLVDGAAEPRYEDMALEAGVTAHRPYAGDTTMPSTGWHAEFDDVNNDGYIDLFVAKGNVEAQEGYAMRDPSNLLIGQPDGTFVEGATDAGIVSFARARGAALVDLNLDGLLDLVVVNRRENVGLWRNVGAGSGERAAPLGNWIAIRLQDDGANRDGIGAWVDVTLGDRVLTREVTVGGGHAGGQLGWIHVGIGDAEQADIVVRWPGGGTTGPITVGAKRFAMIGRDASGPEYWTPPN